MFLAASCYGNQIKLQPDRRCLVLHKPLKHDFNNNYERDGVNLTLSSRSFNLSEYFHALPSDPVTTRFFSSENNESSHSAIAQYFNSKRNELCRVLEAKCCVEVSDVTNITTGTNFRPRMHLNQSSSTFMRITEKYLGVRINCSHAQKTRLWCFLEFTVCQTLGLNHLTEKSNFQYGRAYEKS